MQVDSNIVVPPQAAHPEVNNKNHKENSNENQQTFEVITSDDAVKNDISQEVLSSSFVYTNENNLSEIDKFKKFILENVFDKFTNSNENITLFPTDDFDTSNFSQKTVNPYEESVKHSPFGFVYESTQEFYQKTTFDFSTTATITTPNGEYDIELNFSFTHEYYEKHTTQVSYLSEPMHLNYDKDDDSFKGLKHLDFIFDTNDDEKENMSLFDYIKEILELRHEYLEELKEQREDTKPKSLVNEMLDNFKIWEKNDDKNTPIAMGSQGIGVFLASSYSQSASLKASFSEDGIYVEGSSQSSSVAFAGLMYQNENS